MCHLLFFPSLFIFSSKTDLNLCFFFFFLLQDCRVTEKCTKAKTSQSIAEHPFKAFFIFFFLLDYSDVLFINTPAQCWKKHFIRAVGFLSCCYCWVAITAVCAQWLTFIYRSLHWLVSSYCYLIWLVFSRWVRNKVGCRGTGHWQKQWLLVNSTLTLRTHKMQ